MILHVLLHFSIRRPCAATLFGYSNHKFKEAVMSTVKRIRFGPSTLFPPPVEDDPFATGHDFENLVSYSSVRPLAPVGRSYADGVLQLGRSIVQHTHSELAGARII